jgi:hypothetical protein
VGRPSGVLWVDLAVSCGSAAMVNTTNWHAPLVPDVLSTAFITALQHLVLPPLTSATVPVVPPQTSGPCKPGLQVWYCIFAGLPNRLTERLRLDGDCGTAVGPLQQEGRHTTSSPLPGKCWDGISIEG